MRTMGKVLIAALCLWTAQAWAALPDPITFGWAVERGVFT